MNNEYRIARGWRIFAYVMMPLFSLLFLYLGAVPFLEQSSQTSLYIIMPLVALVVNGLIAWGMVDLYRAKVVLEEDRIVQVTAFRTKELPSALVKGFSEEQNYVVVHPAEAGFPRIKISTYTGRLEELKETLASRYRNLDMETYAAEEQQLLQTESLGATEEERLQQLQGVRNTTRYINMAAVGVSLWLIFYPEPYEWAIYAGALFIPLVLYVVYHYKGLVRIDENPKSAYPNLSTAFVMPSIALGLRGTLDYSIFSYDHLWTWIGVGTAVLYGLTLLITRAYKDMKALGKSLLLLLFLGFFTYGAVVQYNCLNDLSETEVYEAGVLNKRKSGGKRTTYYLELEPWGPSRQPDEVAVPRDLYERVEKGQVMQVYFKQGRIDAPWFVVTD